jgi:putative OmpL-like beta-barrel porin-2
VSGIAQRSRAPWARAARVLGARLALVALPFGLPLAGQESATRVDAFADAYYAFDFNRPRDRTRAYATQPYRHNEFNINLAFVRAQYAGDRFRGSREAAQAPAPFAHS